ncbi:MAG: 30S ribosomal protein S12 methylthiotransferase RimO [Gemmatimonadetes bacterium]|nr:MAG: ribosomal protein S12 methylthiotransferase RimO [Gemmatimonadetes bacterium 13_1_20CM_4_66_11]PYP97796.1 MAG: 30S ribosomal protein S12 methylthiotransferase RimO [Gemmatimonadota bacterium]
MKLGVISLGCDKATVDSERLVGELVGHGAVVTPDLQAADVILVNTCGFIDAAKQESIDAMLEAAKLKTTAAVKAVVAVGCLVQRYKHELQTEIPEVDLFLGFSELHHLVPELAQRGLIADPVAAHPGVRQFLGDQPHVRYLKISEGCDHTCAFCAIPLMRGKHRSEPLARLVREAQQLEAQGAKEINLVAQDLGHWGRDLGLGGPKLPDLLETLLRETSVPWFRLLYVYSAGINERLVELIARESRIVPYIDMPIQHATDRMLERMRRPERLRTLREKLAWLRGAIPDLAIRTTCLVGFPGETEDDFRALLAFLEEAQFDRMGAFAYSPQEGTRAMLYPDDVPDEVKRDRLEEIVEVQRAISGERLARFVGRVVDVLVDRLEAEAGIKVGRVQWQADDVDGVTYLEQGGWAQPGGFVRARITASEDYDFQAAALT